MRRLFVILLSIVLVSLFAEKTKELEEVKVTGVKEKLEKAGTVKDVIIKTEVLTKETMEKKQAANVSEAVDNQVGVQTATGCSMCGMKRIRINGMKGEHTTVLVDDTPLHSTVSSYYGMDALTTAGIASIEIARGSGSSLIAPGAIGGVINLKTKKALEDNLFFDVAVGNEDYRKLSITAANLSDDNKTSSTVFCQYNKQGQWDEDDNGVNESAEIENYSAAIHFSHDFNLDNNFDLRVSSFKSEVFGGPVTKNHHQAIQGNDSLEDEAFVDNNVENDFIGNPLSTLEAITTNRIEGVAKWTRRINDKSNTILTFSGSNQTQDSIYEGADYFSENSSFYTNIKYNNLIHENHLLTAGFDTKQEFLRAKSHEFFSILGLDKDNFDMSSYGLYLQDVWTPLDNLEISAAFRLDKINVNWTDKKAKDDEIDELIPVPRLHIRWDHNDKITSRISSGVGYRAPLTFFESEHGVLEDGFGIEVEDLEESISGGYSLSYDNDQATSTFSANYTSIENLAIITDDHSFDYDGFALVSSDERHQIITLDGVIGYQINKAFNAAISYEHIIYNDEYKTEQFLAQVEDRAKLMLDYEEKTWAVNLTTIWVGERDLTEYGYEGFNQLNEDGSVVLSSKKSTKAPSYFTIDAKISKRLNSEFSFYIGIKNALNYTQFDEDCSPLMFDADGGYDVGYIWGPLRGRQIYSGFQVKL